MTGTKRNVAAIVSMMMVAAWSAAGLALTAPLLSFDAAADPPETYNRTQATGPATLQVKGLATLGLAVCFLDPSFPFPCTPTTGAPSGAGGVIFNVSAANQNSDSNNVSPPGDDTWDDGENCYYTRCDNQVANQVVYGTVWVEYNNTNPELLPLIGGFMISVCTDRDDDGSCTNVDTDGDQDNVAGGGHDHDTDPDFDDQFVDEYSNEELMCDDDPDNCKDKKTDGGPNDAGAFFCFAHDATLAGHDWDEIILFIGAWADENVLLPNEKDNLGAGIAIGNFDAYLDMAPSNTTSDTGIPNACDDNTGPRYQGDGWNVTAQPTDPADGLACSAERIGGVVTTVACLNGNGELTGICTIGAIVPTTGQQDIDCINAGACTAAAGNTDAEAHLVVANATGSQVSATARCGASNVAGPATDVLPVDAAAVTVTGNGVSGQFGCHMRFVNPIDASTGSRAPYVARATCSQDA